MTSAENSIPQVFEHIPWGQRSTQLSALIFLRLIPRAQSKPESGQTLGSHPLGTDAIPNPTLCLAEMAGPSRELFHPLPPMSHPQRLFSEKVGRESRRKCQNAKAVLFFP